MPHVSVHGFGSPPGWRDGLMCHSNVPVESTVSVLRRVSVTVCTGFWTPSSLGSELVS